MADIADLQINIGASADDAIKEINKVQKTLQNLRGSRTSTKIKVDSSDVDKATKKVSTLSNLLSSLKRIAFYRMIRTAIKAITQAFKEGAENAYFFSQAVGTDLAPALDALSSASFTMKNQLGAAFATLLQTIQPVLLQIISLITRVAEAVTQLFAMLGGKSTYMKAADYATKYATAANKGAKATKEWKNQLMGFDEINRLEEPADTGGGAGGGVIPDYGAMFTEAPLGRWFTELRDITMDWWNTLDLTPITAAWERLKIAVADFVGLVDTGLKWAYENVLLPLAGWTIEKLAPTMVENLASAFELLNAIIRKLAPYFFLFFDFVLKPFGKWLGGKIIENIEKLTNMFESLTQKVEDANSLSEFIESLDGKEEIFFSIAVGIGAFVLASTTLSLAKLAIQGLTTVITALSSPAGIAILAVAGLTWGIIQLYKKSDTAREKIDALIEKIKNFDLKQFKIDLSDLVFNWKDLNAEQVLAKFIGSFNAALGTAAGFILGGAPGALIGTLLGIALTAVFSTVKFNHNGKIDKSEVGSLIGPALYGFMGGVVGWFLGGPGGAIIGLTLGIGLHLVLDALGITKGSKVNESDSWIDVIRKSVGFPSDTEIKNAVKKWVWDDGIKAFFDDIGTFFKDIASNIGLTDNQNTGEKIDWWGTIKTALGFSADTDIYGEIKKFIWDDGIKAFFDDIATLMDGLGLSTSEDGISGEGIWSKLTSGLDKCRTDISTTIALIKGYFGGIKSKWDEVVEGVSSKIDAAKEKFDTFKTDLGTTIEGIKSFFSDLWTQAENTVRGIVNTMIGMINNVINKVNELGHINFPGLSIFGQEVIPSFDAQLFQIPLIATFAQGGFPEDGLFFANSGELVGKFSNGQTAVANNEQIVEGVSRGVYEAVITAMSQSGGSSSNQPVNIYLDGRIIAQSSTKYQRQFAKAGIA